MIEGPYNPLDKLNIARSIKTEILGRPPVPIRKCVEITGSGVYLIYYVGDTDIYAPIAAANRDDAWGLPIYIGKAIPKGSRKGGLTADAAKGNALAERIGQHASSIDQGEGISLDDFHVRHLVVDDIWIPLGEAVLIQSFKPVWNRAVDGFGNKDPGKRRKDQYRSPWDVLHPGREFAVKLADSGLAKDLVEERVRDYLADRPMKKYPKVIQEQVEAEKAEAEDAADEA